MTPAEGLRRTLRDWPERDTAEVTPATLGLLLVVDDERSEHERQTVELDAALMRGMAEASTWACWDDDDAMV